MRKIITYSVVFLLLAAVLGFDIFKNDWLFVTPTNVSAANEKAIK